MINFVQHKDLIESLVAKKNTGDKIREWIIESIEPNSVKIDLHNLFVPGLTTCFFIKTNTSDYFGDIVSWCGSDGEVINFVNIGGKVGNAAGNIKEAFAIALNGISENAISCCITKSQLNDFEDFLCDRNDEIDNAAYNLCAVLLGKDAKQLESEFPWQMDIVGNITEDVVSILEDHGYPVCWPYYEDTESGQTPCCATDTCTVPKSECKFLLQYMMNKGEKTDG